MEKDSIDSLKQLEYEFYEQFYNTLMQYYIGLHYANDRSYTEAYMILQKVTTSIEETMEFAQKNNLNSGRVTKDLKELEKNVLGNLNFLICKCHAKVLLEKGEQALKQNKDTDMKVESNT